YPSIRASRERFTYFKALIQVWTDWDYRNEFYMMILLQETRTIFIESCIGYVRGNDLDGISIKLNECKKPYFKNHFKMLLE
ncbi:chitinase-3 protein 2 isoform X1, partial [Biomphalaria glabrata]